MAVEQGKPLAEAKGFRFGLSIDGDEKKNQRISRRPSIARVFQ